MRINVEVENEFTTSVLETTLRLYVHCNWYDTDEIALKLLGFR